MQLINYLNRPEYLLRPIQICRRITRSVGNVDAEDILLPWGLKIKVDPNEVIGRSIWLMGIYDLSVTETLWRLISKGDTTVDIGANIGYVTSLMAKKVGKSGKVYCFEPHPEIYQNLSDNIKIWQQNIDICKINSQNIALSNHAGQGFLEIPINFNDNKGIAALKLGNEKDKQNNNTIPAMGVTVTLARLDEALSNNHQIDLLKIDVEGHELEVLEGATRLLSKQQIRNIVFEDHNSYPSCVSKFLESYNFTIFRINRGFWKPLIEFPTARKNNHCDWEPPNYLATRDPLYATKRLQKPGWYSLFPKLEKIFNQII